MSHWDFGQPADHREPPPPLPFRDRTRAGDAGRGDPGGPGAGAATGAWAADGTWSADGDASPDRGWPADGQWPADGEWPAEESWSADGEWPVAGGWPPATGDQSADGAQDDSAEWTDEYWDGPEGWSAADGWVSAEATGAYPITYERPEAAEGAGTEGAEASTRAWGHQPPPDWASVEDWNLGPDGRAPGAGRHGRRPAQGPRRWLLPAGIAIAAAGLGMAIVLITNGHPNGKSSQQQAGGAFTAPSGTASVPAGTGLSGTTGPTGTTGTGAGAPPLTMVQAQGVMAGYTEANNGANAQRDNAMLATVETGSSYAIDAGLYQMQRGINAAPFPAFGPVRTAYYIPRSEPAGGARWFVVQVANAFFTSPQKVSSTEYLLFTQAAPGGPWLNAVEPYLIAGAGAATVAVGSDGLATAADPAATSFALVPGQLPQLTAASLDAAGASIADPGNLSDRNDEGYWRGKLPSATVIDTHSVTAGAEGQVHALLTTDGGALVFYTDAAELTITPPAGTALHLTVPGFYSPAQALSRAGVSYLEQFAVADPRRGAAATPRVVADYSGITGKN